MLGDGTSHHYQPRPTEDTRRTGCPARTSSLPSPDKPRTTDHSTHARTNARARPHPNHATTPHKPEPNPFKRPADSTTTPPPANHAHRPREHAPRRETRSPPPFLVSLAGRLNGGTGAAQQGESMATPPRMASSAQGGESTGSCAPCELGHALASLAMRGRSCGLAAWGSGPRPGGSSARGATPATPSATGTHARA
jgi:hypothetical protein